MATPDNLRKIHLAAAAASDEVAHYLFGFLNTEVARALRSTILHFDKIPATEAERATLLMEALSATAGAVEKVVADVAQRLQPQQLGPFRDKAFLDTEAAVRKIIMKVFPLVGVQLARVPQPVPVPVPTGLLRALHSPKLKQLLIYPEYSCAELVAAALEIHTKLSMAEKHIFVKILSFMVTHLQDGHLARK